MVASLGRTSTVLKMGTAVFLNTSSASYFIEYTPISSLNTAPEISTLGIVEALVVTVAPSSIYGAPKFSLLFTSPFSDKVGALNELS